MTTIMNQYDALYTNLKNQFTVIYNSTECTVGDFMRMKANKRSESSLPIVTTAARTTSLATIVEYVNDKLTVKKAPVKDKTIRAFPFRASASAFLTASVACAFVLSFALVGARALSTSTTTAADGYHHTVESSETIANAEVDFE